jgi:hypothetical protein
LKRLDKRIKDIGALFLQRCQIVWEQPKLAAKKEKIIPHGFLSRL